MSKKSVVGYSEHRRTDLHIDEAGDKFTINTVQDAEPIVEANKRRYNDYGDKPVSYTHLTLPTILRV